MVEIRVKGITLIISEQLRGQPIKRLGHYFYKDKEGMTYEISREEFIRLGGKDK